MVQNLNGRYICIYNWPEKKLYKRYRANYKLSLLAIIMGIFLLPNLAYLSTITPEKLIDLTNQERQSSGLAPLTANQLLAKAAAEKAQAILQSQSFSHTINQKRFSGWVRAAGYNYSYAGENLAIDFSTSEGIMAAWNNSPLHKENLLNPYYSEIGLAAVNGKFNGQDTTLVVQIFGAPAQATASELAPSNTALRATQLYPTFTQALADQIPAENLMTHAISRENLSSAGDKLILSRDYQTYNQPNKFFAQLQAGLLIGYSLIISLIIFAFSFLYLYFYSFWQINKKISI